MSLVYNVLYCVDDTVIVFTSIFPWQIFVKLLSKSWKQVGWMGCTCRLPFCAVIRHLYFFTTSMTLYFHLKLITVTRKEVHKIFKVKSLQALLKPFSSHCRWDAGKISSVHSKLQARILFKLCKLQSELKSNIIPPYFLSWMMKRKTLCFCHNLRHTS